MEPSNCVAYDDVKAGEVVTAFISDRFGEFVRWGRLDYKPVARVCGMLQIIDTKSCLVVGYTTSKEDAEAILDAAFEELDIYPSVVDPYPYLGGESELALAISVYGTKTKAEREIRARLRTRVRPIR